MPWPVSGPAGELREKLKLPIRGELVFNGRDGEGVLDDRACNAAEALSDAALGAEITHLKTTVTLHTWMIGAAIALNVAIVARLIIWA